MFGGDLGNHFAGFMAGRKIAKLTARADDLYAGLAIVAEIVATENIIGADKNIVAEFLCFSGRVKTVKADRSPATKTFAIGQAGLVMVGCGIPLCG